MQRSIRFLATFPYCAKVATILGVFSVDEVADEMNPDSPAMQRFRDKTFLNRAIR